MVRAGYRTLFARDDDCGSTDAVYKQFRIFDQLLPELARSTLRGRNFLTAFVQPPTGGGPCLLPQPSAHYIPRAPVTLPSIKQRAFCPVSRPEGKLATSTRESLWQLLSPPAWLDGLGGPCWWQKSYHSYLGEVGVDAEMRRRASLMQLWTTQVRPSDIFPSLLVLYVVHLVLLSVSQLSPPPSHVVLRHINVTTFSHGTSVSGCKNRSVFFSAPLTLDTSQTHINNYLNYLLHGATH